MSPDAARSRALVCVTSRKDGITPGIRIPGFDSPVAAPAADGGTLNRRTPTRPLSIRVMERLHARYKRLVRELEDEGFDTSVTELVHALLVTELVHALLEAGPATGEEARAVVRRWRRLLDGD